MSHFLGERGFVNIGFPEHNCKHYPNGFEFLGFINTTTSGATCLNWKYFGGISLPYGDTSEAANYCRMASSDTIYEFRFNQPWCFTDEGPESCNIAYCGKSNSVPIIYLKMNLTILRQNIFPS